MSESLPFALRRLPLDEPPTDLFSDIAATLQARRSRRRWWLPASLAAGVALSWLLAGNEWPTGAPNDTVRVSTTATTAVAATSAAVELQRLSDYSRRLEAWLAATSESAPRDGRSLMAAAELEDLVGLVDVQLSAARDPIESLPLWRQRVALLEDLAAVRSEPALLTVQTLQGSIDTTLL